MKKLKIDSAIQTQVLHSSIFLLSASIEQYILEIYEQILFKVANNSISFSKFPSPTRTLAIIDKQIHHYKRFLFNNDERKLIKELDISKPFYKVFDNSETYSNQFDHKLILNKNKYPSVKNLKIIFFRFGIDDIIAEINARGSKDYELLIDSFLDVREAIAHQVPPPLTYIDVKRHFDNIADSVDKLDRVLFKHVNVNFGIDCWPI